jgi:hypothetical protein
MSRKVKSVSFNLSDQWECEMFEYANKFPNFSSFHKATNSECYEWKK